MSEIVNKKDSTLRFLNRNKQNQDNSLGQLNIRRKDKNIHAIDGSLVINRLLKIKREEYQESLRSSIYKLNSTLSWAKQQTLDLKRTEKMQIKINSKNNANIRIVIDNDKIQLRNESHCKELTIKKIKDDGFIPENNLFTIKQESVRCYEDVFPIYRLGSTLLNHQNKVYIYGGNFLKGLSSALSLHYYDLQAQLWRKVEKAEGDLPYLCTCYHTAEQYRNYLIFIGGLSIDSIRNRRYFNFQIGIFDLHQQKWSKIRWNNSIRSHASTLYGNMLMVYGGINQKDEYLNRMYFISLNINNILQSTIMEISTLNKFKAGIAFHKIVNTYDLEPSLREKIELEGIISYGGKYYDGSVCSEISLFRLNFKGREGFNYSKSQSENGNGWEIVSLKGRKPEGRYDHSLNILNKKGICLMVGGVSQDEQVLNDIWIMDLCSLSWIQAEFDLTYQLLTQGIAGHTSTCDETTIYIFGGIRNNKEKTSKFFSINFAMTREKADRQKNNEENLTRTHTIKKFSIIPLDYTN